MSISEHPQEVLIPPISNRSSILDEYSNRFKSTLQMQFRSNFASAGSFQAASSLPTITYVGSKLRIIFLIYDFV